MGKTKPTNRLHPLIPRNQMKLKKESKKSLNQAETVQPELPVYTNNYLNVSIYLLDSATVAQSGRASASRADVQPDVRVQILNQDESPGGGVFKTFLADINGFDFPLSSYQTPITGHIDILQIRNGLIHILDYKPESNKQNPAEQLTIYALALSRKLNLPIRDFKAAWFDENNYFEFFPLHAAYKSKPDENITAMVK